MKELSQSAYVKRTQKDYSLSLKLQIVQEIEAGRLKIKECTKKYGIQSHSTVLIWLRKHGNFDWEIQIPHSMQKKLLNKELWNWRPK